MLKKFLLLSAFAAASFAATKINLGQIKATISGIAITLPNGDLDVALPGSGLVIIPANGPTPATIQVQFPKQPNVTQVWGVPLRKSGAGYMLTLAPAPGTVDPATVRVYRNGLRLMLGSDYSVDAALTITPVDAWADDDTLQADYSR